MNITQVARLRFHEATALTSQLLQGLQHPSHRTPLLPNHPSGPPQTELGMGPGEAAQDEVVQAPTHLVHISPVASGARRVLTMPILRYLNAGVSP